jgi:hypothetical protein
MAKHIFNLVIFYGSVSPRYIGHAYAIFVTSNVRNVVEMFAPPKSCLSLVHIGYRRQILTGFVNTSYTFVFFLYDLVPLFNCAKYSEDVW